MTIQNFTERRTVLTAELLTHLAGMTAAYTELCNTTGELQQALFRADNRRQNGQKLFNPPVNGMDNVEERVKAIIDFSLFRGNGNVDLAQIIETENSRALKFV